ncbi:uncharacterized protein LOC134216128 isoform X2 [Armigeres subalbatus]
MPYRKKRFESLSDDVVQSLLLYFTSVGRVVDKLISKNDKVVAAWYDTVGDYLHSYLFPVTKYCFYSGNVSYPQVKSVQKYYKQVKLRLDTDGYGWSHPRLDPSAVQPYVQVLKSYQIYTNCSELVFASNAEIPLPKIELDDESHKAISLWVPLKSRQVYDPRTKASLSVLRIYAETVLHCTPTGKQTIQFATRYIRWIDENLTKCLLDAAFYPGLESILRIKKSFEADIAVNSFVKKSVAEDANEFSSAPRGLFATLLGSDDPPSETENEDQDELTEDERRWNRIKVLTATLFFVLFFLILIIVISVKISMNRKTMKRKAAVKKEHFKPPSRRKYLTRREDLSDEEVLLTMEKRPNPSETSGSGWRPFRPPLRRDKNHQEPTTSRPVPPFSDTEEDEFHPLQTNQSERTPLIADQSTKKKRRCGRGCLCLMCITKPKGGHELHDRQNNSAYKLANKKLDPTSNRQKSERPPIIRTDMVKGPP